MSLPSPLQLEGWGQRLREIDPASLAVDPDEGPVRWFLADGGCEIFVWLDPGGLPQQAQLILGRVVLDWSLAAGLSTSSFLDGSASLGGRHDGYLLADGTRDERGVRAGAQILLRAARVGGPLFAPILASLDRALRPPPVPDP